MKNLLTAAIVFLTAACSNAQVPGNAKLYGYRQEVLPGMRPGVISEEATAEVPMQSARLNFFIYLSSPGRVYPSEIWINGQPYGVNTETVRTTPVTITFSEGSQPVTLVPATPDRVIRLTTVPPVESKLTDTGRRLSGENELVVIYRVGDRSYYQVLPRLTVLDAAAMQ